MCVCMCVCAYTYTTRHTHTYTYIIYSVWLQEVGSMAKLWGFTLHFFFLIFFFFLGPFFFNLSSLAAWPSAGCVYVSGQAHTNAHSSICVSGAHVSPPLTWMELHAWAEDAYAHTWSTTRVSGRHLRTCTKIHLHERRVLVHVYESLGLGFACMELCMWVQAPSAYTSMASYVCACLFLPQPGFEQGAAR